MTRNSTGPVETETYQRIAVPTDGSEGANHAAEHGLVIAEALDATAHVISVVESAGSARRDHLRTTPEEIAAEAVEEVEQRASELDVRTETAAISEGPTDEAILQYVDDHDVDLVVMGTHGRTGLDHVVFGSVAEDVLRESPVPVLTVRPPQWED